MAELGFFGFLVILVIFFVFKKAIKHVANKAENIVKDVCDATNTASSALNNEVSKVAIEQHIDHSAELQAAKERLGFPESTATTFAELMEEVNKKK